jgi:Flp pilus assembly protein TadD
MTLRAPFLTLLAVAGLATAQSTKPPPELSLEDKKFSAALLEVRKLAAAEKYQEALDKIREAEALKPDSPIIQNARGSIYTSMRDYDKARQCFKAADALNPGSFESRFNLTELEYVQGNYEAAAASFTAILASFPGMPKQIRALVQFKIVVCRIKLNKIEEAEQLVKKFAFADDSPANFFTQASFAAQKAFSPAENAPYVDALVEAHWITMKTVDRTKK